MRRAIAAGALGAGMLTAAAALTCAVPSSVAYSADSVRWEQTNLAGLGYLPASGVDGVDGAQTHAALKQFQHDNGLAEDGAYGDRSELALHHQVGAVQSKSGSSADGLYGGGTATGVKNWQRAHNLSADGVAGAGTMRAMGIARTVWITAQNQIAARGWSVSTQFSCLEDLWNGESSWKVYATNPSSGGVRHSAGAARHQDGRRRGRLEDQSGHSDQVGAGLYRRRLRLTVRRLPEMAVPFPALVLARRLRHHYWPIVPAPPERQPSVV